MRPSVSSPGSTATCSGRCGAVASRPQRAVFHHRSRGQSRHELPSLQVDLGTSSLTHAAPQELLPWHFLLQSSLSEEDVTSCSQGRLTPLAYASLASRGIGPAEQQELRASEQRLANFRVNFGRGVDAIRQDLPAFFERESDLSVFSEDIAFIDNLSPHAGLSAASCVGKDAYRHVCWSLRFHANLFLSHTKVTVLRLWQRDDHTLVARWSMKAAPRLLSGVKNTWVYMDGVSEFKFNSEGLICQHSIDVVNWHGLQLPSFASNLMVRKDNVVPTCCSQP